MSRSGYGGECESWELVRYRGMVASAIRGKRGQSLIRDLGIALDAMPVKELVEDEFAYDGKVCALGAVANFRNVDIGHINPARDDCREETATLLHIATCLASEIMYENDEGVGPWSNSPEERWHHMRDWVAANLKNQAEPEALKEDRKSVV